MKGATGSRGRLSRLDFSLLLRRAERETLIHVINDKIARKRANCRNVSKKDYLSILLHFVFFSWSYLFDYPCYSIKMCIGLGTI